MKRGARMRGAAIMGGLALCAPAAFADPLVTARPLDLHIWRLLIALLVCIGLAIVAAFVLKRALRNRGAPGRFGVSLGLPRLKSSTVAVLEARRISMHADVCRLGYEGREYLVVVSPGGATVLHERAVEAESAP